MGTYTLGRGVVQLLVTCADPLRQFATNTHGVRGSSDRTDRTAGRL